MNTRIAIIAAFGLASACALATDHNNLDSGRPLRFDDAYSIAFRERAIEFVFSVDTFRRSSPTYGLKAEYKFGFAKNRDIGISFEPSYSGAERRFDANNVELSYFHGIRREIENQPAIAYKIDLGLPTGRDSRGVDLRFRGIATKALGQYDKLHLNLDAIYASKPGSSERNVVFGAILGYSTPLGYPKQFNQTLVAEFALQQSKVRGQGYTGTIGLGMRRQIGVRSVLDFGIESDVLATKGAQKDSVRLIIGYSIGF